jgi:hypothetical protein
MFFYSSGDRSRFFYGQLSDVERFMDSIGNIWLYLVFFGIVFAMLLIDFLGFKQKKDQSVPLNRH